MNKKLCPARIGPIVAAGQRWRGQAGECSRLELLAVGLQRLLQADHRIDHRRVDFWPLRRIITPAANRPFLPNPARPALLQALPRQGLAEGSLDLITVSPYRLYRFGIRGFAWFSGF